MAAKSIFSWLTGVNNKSRRAGKKRQPVQRHFLGLEALEDRVVLSTAVSIAVDSPAPVFSEGVVVNLSSTVEDPVGMVTYDWKVFKDDTLSPFETGSDATFSFTPDDDGTYLVQLSVTDEAPGSVTDTETLTVANQPPVAGVIGPATGNFGQSLSFMLTATDAAADAAEGFTYHIDWNNDGVVDETVAAAPGNGAGIPVSHTFAAPGPNTFSVTATDKDGAVSAQVSNTVTILNGAAVVSGVLIVASTPGNDTITISPVGDAGTVEVVLNNVSQGTFTPTERLVIYAGDGDDVVVVAGSITHSALLYGDAGNDQLQGGGGGDVLLGGDGDDLLVGGRGRDVMIGGLGADRLVGNADDDLLIAGSTNYDGNEAELSAIKSIWTGLGGYTERVAALNDPAAAVHLIAEGTSTTVIDDGAVDMLIGASGSDWYFANLFDDTISGLSGGEFVN